jgi:signal transduction histidine kinase
VTNTDPIILENTVNLETLRHQLLFAGLSEQDIDWLTSKAIQVTIPAGAYLMREGEPGDALYIVVDGEFQVTKRAGNQDVVIATRGEGELFGEMSLLDRAPHSASARARRDSHLFKVSGDVFRELLSTRPQATLSILRTVTERLRNTEAMLRQSEKMAALGTLSAGLAHELNNPAAAAQRSAAQLRDTLVEWQRAAAALTARALDARQREAINALRVEMATRAATPANLDPLTRSDRESEVQTWLEERGVDRAWELAPPLVAFGWDARTLGTLGDVFGDQVGAVAQWLGVGYSVYALLGEVSQSAGRISEIVQAVKSYAYLDQAPIQQVDVHAGLENTLVILRHKLKSGIRVTRDFAPDLPRIEAYGSELNQVWTNIIDNAIDAMKGSGDLTLRTYRQEDYVVVEITDTGPGIPPDILPRLFEAFFTTKPPGIGTGLGLHISYNIVEKHKGQIGVDSKPGATTFRVALPIQLKRGDA